MSDDWKNPGNCPLSPSAQIIFEPAIATRVGHEEIQPRNSSRSYNPTPIDRRSLQIDGDPLEKYAYPKLNALFPQYESLWKALIWDVTDRDFTPGIYQPRRDCPERLRELAEAHYTFFRSLMMALALLETKALSTPSPLDPYYLNERFLFFYSHLGRIRDMVCLMLERIGQESGSLSGGISLRRQSGNFDYKCVKQFVDNISKHCSNIFDDWQKEVMGYRNLLHQVANAVRIDQEVHRVLKPDLIKGRKGGWVQIMNSPLSDFVEVEGIMKKHFNAITEWGKPIWNFFEATVDGWRKDNSFHTRLNLPK